MLSIVVLISGAGSNLLALLEATDNPLFGAKIVAVGSDNPADGLAHAENFGISTFVVSPESFDTRENWANVLLANVQHFKPDLVVLAGFMRILPPNFVQAQHTPFAVAGIPWRTCGARCSLRRSQNHRRHNPHRRRRCRHWPAPSSSGGFDYPRRL